MPKGMFSTAVIMAGLIFGSVGFVAFMYGKKQGSAKAIVIGVLLMAYPYFIQNTIALYGIGIALTIALFIFRD